MSKLSLKTLICCIILLICVSVGIYLFTNTNNDTMKDNNMDDKILKYEANQYVPISITDSDIANKYLNDYKNLLIYDLEGAYELLNEEYKIKKYGSFEKFKELIIKEYSKNFYSLSVNEYSVLNRDGKKFFYIKDSRDNTFIFREFSIMNYEVYLDDYTIKLS